MNQSGLGFILTTKRARTRRDEMGRMVHLQESIPFCRRTPPEIQRRRRPFPNETMLRIHASAVWPEPPRLGRRAARYADVPRLCLDDFSRKVRDATTMRRYPHLLEDSKLADRIPPVVHDKLLNDGPLMRSGMVVDATLIAAPRSTKNAGGECDPDMHQTKKQNQWHFGMKSHIGVDAESSSVHTVLGTSGNANDVTLVSALLNVDEIAVFAYTGYVGVVKRPKVDGSTKWHVAIRPGKRKALDLNGPLAKMINQIEKIKAGLRAKVQHPFWEIMRQFGFGKVRYPGLNARVALGKL